MSKQVTVRIHYEVEFTMTVSDAVDLTDAVLNEADIRTKTLTRDDLEWLGTYAEDEDGEELLSVS